MPVTEERGLFLRECSNRMYSISAYFLSKNLVELPLHTILSILFGTIGYAMAGLRNDGSGAKESQRNSTFLLDGTLD